ncbi:MAG TPA: D-2-hydroxyacid dehydrogenase [Chloroflexota bacterium]|nr:D-2-hydroxyacid dehydrogenase [Chloroflexota bacterium]
MSLRVIIGEDVGKENVERLRARFPEVSFALAFTRDELIARAADADVIFTKNVPAAAIERASDLRWLQAGVAGVDGILANGLLHHPALLTCARGAHGVSMSEHILAMMFALANRVPTLVEGRMTRQRVRQEVIHQKWQLEGQTIGIVGLGDVGGTLARKSKALGLVVFGVRRGNEPFPGIDGLYARDSLPELLPRLDHIALCLPGTAETRHVLGRREIALLKPNACVYNVGRGSAIDQEALIEALRARHIAGAGLDVSTPDPPTEDSPLWDLPNVILGQHTSGHSPTNHYQITTIFADNLARFLSNQPLLNLVDKERGY